MQIRTLFAALLTILFISCSNPASDLSVVSKSLQHDVNASTAGGMGEVPSSGSIYWVEGKVKNSGETDLNHVTSISGRQSRCRAPGSGWSKKTRG